MTRLFPKSVDQRSGAARRFRDLCHDLGRELGGPGGFKTLSESRRQLVRRAAHLALECETAETDRALGRPVDLGHYIRAAGTMRRILAGLRETAPPPALPPELYRDPLGFEHPPLLDH